MDTLRYYDKDMNIIHNGYYSKDISFDNTDGTNPLNLICNYCGNTIYSDEECFIESEVYCNECVVFSEYENRYILNNEAVFCDDMQDYIHENNSVRLYDDNYNPISESVCLYNNEYADRNDENLCQDIHGEYFIIEH